MDVLIVFAASAIPGILLNTPRGTASKARGTARGPEARIDGGSQRAVMIGRLSAAVFVRRSI